MNGNIKMIAEIKSGGYIEISDVEYELLRSLVYKQIGINLSHDKRTLLTGRLQKVLRKMKFASFKEYYNYVISDSSGEAVSDLANHIATNHTYFGRESEHFEFFEKICLPEIVARAEQTRNKDIRIWCAGSSTGEEPYTLAMIMMDFFGSEYKNWQAGLLASDISLKALTIAKEGIYADDKIASLPDRFKNKYLKRVENGNWSIIDSVKKEVVYKRFNLITPQFPFKKPFDVIFCRNVMIYFDEITRTTLVNKFANLTVSNGYLFIGHSESIPRNTSPFTFIKPAVYKKF